MSTMRAKMSVTKVERVVGGDRVTFNAVCRSDKYPDDGSDEDNTYAKFSPQAELQIFIANPALLGVIEPGQKFYVDFEKAD